MATDRRSQTDWPAHLPRPPGASEKWLWKLISRFPDYEVRLTQAQLSIVRCYLIDLPPAPPEDAFDENKHRRPAPRDEWPAWAQPLSKIHPSAGFLKMQQPQAYDVGIFLRKILGFNEPKPRIETTRRRPPPSKRQRDAVVKAVDTLGRDAAVKNILLEAAINEKAARAILREMQHDGEYDGHQRRKSS